MAASSAWRGDIQGMRGLAVLAVVVFHVGVFAPHPLLPGGYVGVDVFFVISGYVVTRGLLARLDAHGKVAFGRFYAHRVRRILPALALLLVVVVPAAQWLGPVGGATASARTGAAASVSLANVYLIRSGGEGYFAEAAELNSLLHTWSLSVEEQFYLVLPAALALGWALGRRRRSAGRTPDDTRAADAGAGPAGTGGLVVVLAAGTAASLALSLLLTAPFGSASDGLPEIAFYSPFSRAWEFGTGCLLAVAAARGRHLPHRLAGPAGVAGLALLAGAAVGFDASTPFPGVAALVPVSAAGLLIAAGEADLRPVGRALAWRPLQAVGDRSYSWYLWHWPGIVFAAALWPRAPWAAAAGALVSLLPAEVARRVVEEPIRRRPLAGRRAAALAAACVGAPLLVVAAVVVAPEPGATVEQLEARFAHHADLTDGCSATPGLGPDDEGACTYPLPGGDASGRAVLVGDSNAGHLTEGFVAAAHARGLDAVVATHSGCPFVGPGVGRDPDQRRDCRAAVERTLDTLTGDPPAVVVVASATDEYLTDDRYLLAPTDGGPLERPRAGRWEDELTTTLATLARGSRVAVVHPPPRFPGWVARRCAVLRWQADAAGCGTERDAGEAASARAEAVAVEDEALDRVRAEGGDVRALDPFPTLCPDDPCRTEVAGTWLFRDEGHLSIDGSLALADQLERAMAGPPLGP